MAHERIRRAGAETAQHADKRRKARNARRGTDDEYRADKRRQNAENVHLLRVLTQNEYGKDNGKERRELVEHIGVGNTDMVNGPKVCHHTDHTGDAAQEMPAETALVNAKAFSLARENGKGGKRRHQIAEENLLHDGNVSGEPDKNRHQRETECRA